MIAFGFCLIIAISFGIITILAIKAILQKHPKIGPEPLHYPKTKPNPVKDFKRAMKLARKSGVSLTQITEIINLEYINDVHEL